MHKTPAHVIISWVFLILIGIVFGYSYFFYPDTHPVGCLVKSYTGKDCATCGFSRSFSCYTHFQFNEGRIFNALSWPVFLFFVFQFCWRFFVVAAYYFTKKALSPALIKTDAVISISGFLLAFLPILFKTH
jgi:hypothetical protein